MRKLLAGFLAASMVASIGATMSFAATSNTAAYITKDNAFSTAGTYDAIRLTISPDTTIDSADDIYAVASVDVTVTSAASLAEDLDGVKFNDVVIAGEVYNLTLKHTSGDGLRLNFSPATKVDGLLGTSLVRLEISNDGGKTWGNNIWASTDLATISTYSLGTGGELVDVEKEGDFSNISVTDVIRSYGDGTPIPLTESGVGVDNDLNDQGGVQSGKTIYFEIKDDVIPRLGDDQYWKIKYTKGANGKQIKAMSDVTKIFGQMYDANTGSPVPGTGGNERRRYLKVELNDVFTDDEYKIKLDMRISAANKATSVLGYDDSTLIKVKDFSFYLKNIVRTADNDWKVGVGGLMLNPLENDWNTVTWYDEDGDLAYLNFFADSDVGKFFSKLSTKWEHADYASYFNDQDAYIFDFVGSPKLSATSRADLAIYNPFVDDDGNETIDPASATIYQVIDGDLFDVTDSFEYKEADSGDMAFVTRTRFLGTYILCEKPVEEAADTEAPDTDLVPSDTTPSDVTPDKSNGGKAPASTGRYA